jgi:hypothetical protein
MPEKNTVANPCFVKENVSSSEEASNPLSDDYSLLPYTQNLTLFLCGYGRLLFGFPSVVATIMD